MAGGIRAWHFLQVPFGDYPPRLGYGDDRIVEVGKTLSVKPKLLDLCAYGLHASVDIMHALAYGRGMLCCRVVLSGKIITVDNAEKLCASRRRVLAWADITDQSNAWVNWLLLEALRDWHECPAVIRRWIKYGEFSAMDARTAATYVYQKHTGDVIEALADLVRQITLSDDPAHKAARAVRWLLTSANRCRFVSLDMARANLMERIAPLFDAALLEDK